MRGDHGWEPSEESFSMRHHERSSLPTRRSFARRLLRLSGAGIAISALAQGDLAQPSVYAQNHQGGNDQGGNDQGGNNRGGDNHRAPEIAAGAAVSALALLSGVALMLSD